MYEYQKEIIIEKQSYKYTIYKKGEKLSYIDFIGLLQKDEEFRLFFINLLSNSSFHAYQWETPPVNASTIQQPIEFVITRRPGIDLPPDSGSLRQYFSGINNEDDIVVFNNLGNDAKLIAPAPIGQDINYSHIGVFTHSAPLGQQQELWRTVGIVTAEMLAGDPIWLNTAGGGVAWLHVRLDSRPKYYRHQPYKKFEKKS